MAQKSDPAVDDLALVLGASEDRESLAVLRKKGEALSAAVLRRAEEGKPIHGELLRLKARDEPLLFDVETVYEPPAEAKSGPAQVASDRYRRGWDRLFSRKSRGSAAGPS